MGVLCTSLVLATAAGLGLLNFETGMRDIAVDYLLVMSLCAAPFCLQPALRGTLEGMNFTFVVFLVNFTAFLLNIPLDYVLVNGLYGFPKLGGVGCAWATVMLVWMMVLFLALALWRHPKIRHRRLFSQFEAPKRDEIVATWRLGFPIGLAIVIELSMFCGAGMLIALFGPVQASAHAVAITIASISFMLYNGLAQGVTIRASQFLGADRGARAAYTVRAGISFNLLIAALVCVFFLLFNESIVTLFTSDPAVIAAAVVLLYFGAAFQLGDSLQVAVVFALRAYQDTVTPPKIMFFGFFMVGLPIGIWLAFFAGIDSLSAAKGLWFGMVSSLFLVGFLLLRKLSRDIQSFDPNEYDSQELIV
jgi:MATE family multidrug resistance protein